MSEFYVGQEVVCINAKPNNDGIPAPYLSEGKRYTIEGFCKRTHSDQGVGIFVAGIFLEIAAPICNCFRIERFRPIKSESIEIFRQMCISKKPLVKV